MKRTILAVTFMFANLAYAADDAPIVVSPLPGYVCVAEVQRLNEGKAYARCQDTNKAYLKDNVVIPVPEFVAITAGGIIVTAVVTGLIVGFAKK